MTIGRSETRIAFSNDFSQLSAKNSASQRQPLRNAHIKMCPPSPAPRFVVRSKLHSWTLKAWTTTAELGNPVLSGAYPQTRLFSINLHKRLRYSHTAPTVAHFAAVPVTGQASVCPSGTQIVAVTGSHGHSQAGLAVR